MPESSEEVADPQEAAVAEEIKVEAVKQEPRPEPRPRKLSP